MIKNKLLSLFLIATSSCFLWQCHSQKDPDQKSAANKNTISFIEGIVVRPVTLDYSISISGTIRPFEETVLMPEVSGRVIKIHLPEGQRVKEGALLVKIFDGDLQAQLKKQQTELQIAEQTQKRQSELLKVNGISQYDYDQTELQVVSIKNDIELTNVAIRKTEVLAPFSGVIGLRNISIGAQVTTSTPLATIREEDKLKLDFSVPEKYSQEVKPGKKIRFTIQGDDKEYTATIMATEQGIEANTRNLRGRAVIDTRSSSLIPGAYANVELELEKNQYTLMIPSQSIIPQERNKKVILCKNGKAKFVTVKTGVRQDEKVQILSGIQDGDTIVTTGILFIKQGEALKFAKVTK